VIQTIRGGGKREWVPNCQIDLIFTTRKKKTGKEIREKKGRGKSGMHFPSPTVRGIREKKKKDTGRNREVEGGKKHTVGVPSLVGEDREFAKNI